VRILELGQYLVPAYAGLLLAEQGHEVTKWTGAAPDPIEGLKRGDELWEWINKGKFLYEHHARHVASYIGTGAFDAVIDNFRAEAWERWRVSPGKLAVAAGVPWVSMRDDFDGRSFDAVAQARAWGDHLGDLPVYLGDTAGGLWLAFKLLNAAPGHHVLRQAACLAKLVEGELVVREKRQRPGGLTPWDEPGTYGPFEDGTRVIFRGEHVIEPFRDDQWRWDNLRHVNGRYVI